MPSLRRLSILCLAMLGVSVGPAVAQGLDDAAIHAPPQHYLIILPPTPVAEVAEVVLGQTLGLPFKVDADVEADMPFRADGLYAPQELAREFGYRLWNVDVVLIERPSDGLWLIPEVELPAALAAGASVVSPLASTPATPPRGRSVEAARAAPAVAPKRSWAWLGWLIGGWIAGAASAAGWTRLNRRRTPRLPVLLPTFAATETVHPNDDELTIPAFRKK